MNTMTTSVLVAMSNLHMQVHETMQLRAFFPDVLPVRRAR